MTTKEQLQNYINELNELATLHAQCSELILSMRFVSSMIIKYPDNELYKRSLKILNAMYFKRTQNLFFKS